MDGSAYCSNGRRVHWTDQSSSKDSMDGHMRISDWYAGRSVLVTGGTGFMGKVLIEKLLRSCPRLESIYLLIRPKRGQQVSDRLKQLLKLPIFDEVRKSPGLVEKVHVMESEVTQPALGLTPEDQAVLRDRVSVIFHSAATVKFDECLKVAVAINMSATKSLIELAQTMPKLEAMVHVSTAYCNCNRREVGEQVYPTQQEPEALIRTAQNLESELLDVLTPKLLEDRPNTYTLTKAHAEQIINEQSGILPIAIVRPSIVTAAWKEPIPGWIDNLNGPTGLLVGAGKGVLRSLRCDRENVADMIPVDIAINFCIAVAWYTAITRPNNIIVYNCTTGALNPIRWQDLEVWGQIFIIKYPSSQIMWYPGGSFKKYWVTNFVAVQLLQRFPSLLFDICARLSGHKPTMMKIQDRMLKASTILEFFTTNEFKFSSDNMAELWNRLSPEDKEIFNFDITKIEWKPYLETYVLGIRRFILKEDPENIPTARRNLVKLQILHRLAQLSFFVASIVILFSRSLTAKRLFVYLLRLLMKAGNQIMSNLYISS